MDKDCIFCKIANKEIPADFVYENDFVIAFKDLSPQAPSHIVLIPKMHFSDLSQLNDEKIMSEIIKGIQSVTKKLNIKEYRTVVNTGAEAGQTVFHIHVHILSGRPMLWPPG